MVVRSPSQTMVNTEWKVLIIDDDEDDFLIAREMLKEARGRKFDIHWANTYAAGRDELISNQYHAVLVDYDLGIHSGIELIREANEWGHAAPLILFTGRGSYEVDVEAMEAGATMYLTKGEVHPLLLERAIRYAIEIKQRENELREARETAERELSERKRAEDELRKSEAALRRMDARWNAAIESINVGAIIATEDEQVIYWNPAAQQMHGFTRSDEGIEPLEKTPITFQLWMPDGSHLLELDEWPMRRIKRGEPVRDLELRIRRPDQGWEKIFSYSGVMVDTSGGERLIFLTCLDVTEQRRMEGAMRVSEERLRLALDAARMVAWEYDPATLKVTLSENAEAVLELPQRHENSDQGYGLIHPDDLEHHRALVTQAIAAGGSYVSVYRHPHPGKVIWLEEHARAVVDTADKTIRLVGVVQNITDRKQAEAALRQSEEKYAKSFRSSPAAIAISTLAEGRFTEVNERFSEIFGYSREEMIGHTSIELGFYPNPAERNEILRLLQEEGHFRDYEIRMRNRNGEPRDLLFSGERIEIEGQDYLLALIMDITDRKQAEAALRANAEALQANSRALQESQARIIEFVENIQNNYFTLDREWRITYANRRFAEVVGKDRSEMLGKNFWEVFPQYQRDGVEPHYRKAMTERVPVHFQAGGIYSKALFDISLYPTQEGLASFSIDRTQELRKQQQVEDERARWQGVVEGIADEVWLCDIQGRMSLINLPDRTAMGLEEFQDWPYEKVLEEVDAFNLDMQPRSADQAPLIRALRGEIVRGEEILRHRKTGKTRYRRYSAAPTRDPAGQITGSVAIIHDITPQKQAEQALRESEERFREILENTHDHFYSLDHDWRFRYANQPFSRLMGMPTDQLIGKSFWELFPRYLGTPVEQYYRKAMAEQAHVHFEIGTIYTDFIFEVNVYPSRSGITVVGIDRTEEKKAQAAMQAAYARLRFFVDANIVGVTIYQEDGTLIEANDYYLELIGQTRAELEAGSLNWRSFTSAEYLPIDNQAIEALKAGGFSPVYEKEYIRPDGSRVWVLIRRALLPDDTFAAFVLDINERKQAEKTLAETAEKLARSNRELEEFAFVASHDLQEPLRKVIMFGDRLRDHLCETPDETADDYLARMQDAARRMQAMISGLLDLSRVNTKGRELIPLNLNHVVGEVVEDLEARIQAANGQVNIESLPLIQGDEVQIRELFQNLIGNALKFHQPDVPPVVQVSGTIRQTMDAPIAEIRVEDNGIGFEQEHAQRIFQPFQRLHGKSEYEGTGLGLAICQKIVERHHGTIEVESVPGKGSTFIIRLPSS